MSYRSSVNIPYISCANEIQESKPEKCREIGNFKIIQHLKMHPFYSNVVRGASSCIMFELNIFADVQCGTRGVPRQLCSQWVESFLLRDIHYSSKLSNVLNYSIFEQASLRYELLSSALCFRAAVT